MRTLVTKKHTSESEQFVQQLKESNVQGFEDGDEKLKNFPAFENGDEKSFQCPANAVNFQTCQNVTSKEKGITEP